MSKGKQIQVRLDVEDLETLDAAVRERRVADPSKTWTRASLLRVLVRGLKRKR